jgi:hypothetical protein
MGLRRKPDYDFSLQSFPSDADTGTVIDVVDLGAMDVSSGDDNTDEKALSIVSSEASDHYYSGVWWVQGSPVPGVNFTMEAKPYASYTVPASTLSTTGEQKGTRANGLSVGWEAAQDKTEFVYLQANAVQADVIGAYDPLLDQKYNSLLKVLYYENDYSIRHDILHGEQSRYTQLLAQDLIIVKNGYEVTLGNVEGAISLNIDESKIDAKVGFPKTTVLTAIEERAINFSGQLQNVDPAVLALILDEDIQFTNGGSKLKVTNNVGEKKTYELIIRGINKAKEIVEWRFPKSQLSIDGAIDLGKTQSYLGFRVDALLNEESGDNEIAEFFIAPAKSVLLTYPIKYKLNTA